MVFSTAIYKSWEKKQCQKYEALYPQIKGYLKKSFSVLDMGIGKAWLESSLEKKGLKFKEVIGIDVDEAMIRPQKKDITYFITNEFMTARKFDLVICFDTLHLLPEPKRLLEYSKNLVLVSLPKAFESQLEVFRDQKILEEGDIGEEEKDHFLLIRV